MSSTPPEGAPPVQDSVDKQRKTKKAGYWQKVRAAKKKAKAGSGPTTGASTSAAAPAVPAPAATTASPGVARTPTVHQNPPPVVAETEGEIDDDEGFRIDGPIQDYFDRFLPWFVFDPHNPTWSEFQRLRREVGALDDDAADALDFDHDQEREEFQQALVDHFNHRYGTDAGSVASWQHLCRMLRIDPVPDELKAAKEAVCNTHVNLVDLTTGGYENMDIIQIFPTEKELSEYTLTPPTKKFPRKLVRNGTILWMLLRMIDNPPAVDTRRDENNRVIVPGAPQEEPKKKKTNKRRGRKRGSGGGGPGGVESA